MWLLELLVLSVQAKSKESTPRANRRSSADQV
jgi:hypothetical protein